MGDNYCSLCNKTIKLKNEKKHLNTKSHRVLSESIINKYCVKIPELVKIEEISNKHVNYYNRRFQVFGIICKWTLHFIDFAVCVKSKKLYSNNTNWGLILYLKTKFEYFSRRGWKFSHIPQMALTFTEKLCNMTYEHYLEQPKPMIEWIVKKKAI